MLIKNIAIVNIIIMMLLGLGGILPSQAIAQSEFGRSFEFDDFDEFEDEFDEFSDSDIEEGFDDSEEFSADEQAFFEGGDGEDDGEYIDASLIPEGAERSLELSLLRQRALLLEEKINAPLNSAYGAGTGLMIGGWFALLSSRTSRDTLRSIGLGIVFGSIIGAVIGTRSVWDPNAPRPPGLLPDPREAPAEGNGGASILKDNGIQLAFRWEF